MHPKAPITLIIFNRPEETSRVLDAIRQVKPGKLFVIADGPRTSSEKALTDAARAVIDTVDWPCEVIKNYSDINLNSRERIISGLNWLFSQVERAIILEDDCLPHPTFFPFCDELLEKYKNDPKVMSVAGTFLFQKELGASIKESYFAMLMPQATGWATWKRAWDLYDPDMEAWPALRDSKALASVFNHPGGYERFERVWDDYYYKRPSVKDSWDGAWVFASVAHDAVCLSPSVNLVSNIGFNERGTHSKVDHPQANLPTYPTHFPLIHPKTLIINYKVDAYFYRYSLGVDQQWRYRLVRPLKTHFPTFYQKIKKLLR